MSLSFKIWCNVNVASFLPMIMGLYLWSKILFYQICCYPVVSKHSAYTTFSIFTSHYQNFIKKINFTAKFSAGTQLFCCHCVCFQTIPCQHHPAIFRVSVVSLAGARLAKSSWLTFLLDKIKFWGKNTVIWCIVLKLKYYLNNKHFVPNF